MSTTYSVVLALSTTGSLDAKLTNVGARAQHAHSAMATLGHGAHRVGESIKHAGESLGGFVEGIVDKVSGVGEALGKAAVVGGIAAVTYGVGKLNNELEQTQISLATIFQTQGFANDFTMATGIAQKQLALMKQDIKTLPGDLGQLSTIMKTIATPAAQGGADADAIRKLAGRGMLVGRILGVQQEVVSRELANLLAGRAGAHNILGSRLGLIGGEAQRFNKQSAQGRVAEITKLFNTPAMDAAAKAFANTWVAQTTTLADNIKYALLAPATAPIFERLKADLGYVNTWFDHNSDKVAGFTRMVGEDLVKAWGAVEHALARIEPYVGRMVNGLGQLTGKRVEGMAARAGVGLLVAKAAGPAISGGAGMMGGALSAAGSVARIASSAATMSALGTAFAALANPVVLGALAAGVALLATGAVAAVGAIHALTDETSAFHEYAVGLWQEISRIGEDALGRLRGAFDEVRMSLTPVVDLMGSDLLFALRETAPLLTAVASGFVAAASGLRHMLSVLSRFPGMGGLDPEAGAAGPGLGRGQVSTRGGPAGKGGLKALGDEFADKLAKHGAGGGGGGTHVQKVEIVVNSNQDPSRIARATAIEFKKWARNPKASQHVSDYSTP